MNKIGNTTAASAISDPLLSRRRVDREDENPEFMWIKKAPTAGWQYKAGPQLLPRCQRELSLPLDYQS